MKGCLTVLLCLFFITGCSNTEVNPIEYESKDISFKSPSKDAPVELNISFSMNYVYRGENANKFIHQENVYNPKSEEGYEWVVVNVEINTSDPKEPKNNDEKERMKYHEPYYYASEHLFSFVDKNKKEFTNTGKAVLDGALNEMVPTYSNETGLIAGQVKKGEPFYIKFHPYKGEDLYIPSKEIKE
ncbi:hypothetical protein QUF99_14005 [Bacillus sp. DX4.1]|uniref:hypothetical protein n=1 Tax=Bacillus sp. DX4.1 TaxID=3055867 RepID=UPI0025A20A56|nr:hypothetical protein [Bacillus sp. DX4.1]MDM5188390.1 hypothetical protein [Bacillus sp. DX4.1]